MTLASKPKNSLQIFNTVEFKLSVHEHFQPRIKRQKQHHDGGEMEQTNLPLWSRAGIRSIFGNTCACKLPVGECTELADGSKSPELADWAELLRCNLQGVCTFLLPLALRRATVLSGCIFPTFFTLSLQGHRNTWLQTIIFPSDWDSSWDLRKLSLRLLYTFRVCVAMFFSHPRFYSHPLWISRQFFFPAKVDQNLCQDMVPRYEKFL